jgi:hypothetical protein
MKTATINLYQFSELSKEAKQLAFNEHEEFLLSVGQECENEDGEMVTEYEETIDEKIVIESLEINAYYFFADGKLASCTTYTGDHPRAGEEEMRLHGETYPLQK